jgi:hypothetical protein
VNPGYNITQELVDMRKLICPHCGDATAPVPFSFKAKIVFEDRALAHAVPTYPYHEGTAEAITIPIDDQRTYGIIICQSCGRHFVAEKEAAGWLAVYPIQHKYVAKEIPEPIRSEFEEANLCFAIGAYKACIAICMVALESLWQQQNASGLSDLKDKGVISSRLFDQANEVRHWAGLVKHQLIHETATSEETEELLTYLEEILHDVYVRPARLGALGKKREQVKKGNKSEASPSSSQ